MTADDPLVVGRISGVFGTRGWLKIHSYGRPRDSILAYEEWLLQRDGKWQRRRVMASRRQGNGLIASLDQLTDRDEAVALIGSAIAIPREALPPIAHDEFYWADLIGLEVVNRARESLGTITRLLDTGAHDVLVVEAEDRERLIPFVMGQYIDSVDLHARRMLVDWHRDD